MHTYAYMGARGGLAIKTKIEFCINISKTAKKVEKVSKNALQKLLNALLYAGCHKEGKIWEIRGENATIHYILLSKKFVKQFEKCLKKLLQNR